MSTALIAIEGVLGEHSPVHGFHPIIEGVRLARSLHSEFQVVFSTIQADTGPVEFWLRINGMAKPSFYEELHYREVRWSDIPEADLLAVHALNLRSAGHDVGTVLSADPTSVLALTEAGFPCLFFVNPAYHWAEYRPDRRRLPTPWQAIDDEMIRQRVLKASDPRLNEIEEEPA